MAVALELYVAGLVATLATSLPSERDRPAHQRNGVAAQVALALLWPLYLLFLAAVAIAAAANDEG